MRLKLPRESFIPKGAVKVAAKNSSAVAYIMTNSKGKPAAMLFMGKQAKPTWHFYFNTEAARAKKIAEAFERAASWEASKAESKAKAKAEIRLAKVGSIYSRSWGYEQTNVDYYEVVELVGKSSVKVRKIAAKTIETSFMSGKCVPLPGSYVGEPVLCRAKGRYIKVGNYRGANASLLEPKMIAGIPVYEPSFTSWYG